MYSRWYHPPKLHSPAPGRTKKVGWIELFFDLIYVAAIIQLGNGLSEDVSLGGFLAFAALFTPLWLAWTSFTFYMNRFTVDDFAHRGLVFVQMFAIGAVAISAPAVMLHGSTKAFALSFGTVRAVMAVLYYRTGKGTSQTRELSAFWTKLFGVEAAIWYVSAYLPQPWVYVAWAVAVGIAFSLPLSRHSRELSQQHPPDVVHFTERYGLLVIIVLGESFVKVLSQLSTLGNGIEVYAMGCAAMLVTCTLWWIYFDDIAESRIKPTTGAMFVWVYGHLPLTLAVTAVGVAVKKVAILDPAVVAPYTKYYWLLCGSLALALVAVALLDMVTERRQSDITDRWTINLRLGSALALLLIPIMAAGMPAWGFITMVLVFCIGQVVLDMVMAPEAMDAEELHHAEHRELADRMKARPDATTASDGSQGDAISRMAPAGAKPMGKSIRRDISDTVRRGTPNELRRDIYFFVIESTWLRFFFATGALYLFANVIFAALYMLEPGSVQGVRPGSFLDAFFFSVQTLSTIGYGGMTPITEYGNIIMTVEAGAGMLGVAMITGLMFAKASRPRSSVLFSESMVVTSYNGKPTLMLRAGNARGNEVVEASVTMAAIIDEVSPEGHHIRRIQDLKLVRRTSPVFTITWTIMHTLDESSPLEGCAWGEPNSKLLAIIVTMLGHDATYGQTTHARHAYYPDDIRPEHDFVDVISELEDGRMMVDYALFHDTVPHGPKA